MRFLLAALTGCLLTTTASLQTVDSFAEVKKAAQAGDAKAQFRLGQAYQDGDVGTPQDDTQACRWFERAAYLPDCHGLASSRRRPCAVSGAERIVPKRAGDDGSSRTLAPAEVLAAAARTATSTAASRPLARAAINEP